MDGFLLPGMPFYGYAIKHPRGVVLVDTGFGTVFGDTGRRGEVRRERDGQLMVWPWSRRHTNEALADHNIDPGDVRYIINTHLGDHSGDNIDFKEATFFIQEPEINYVRNAFPADNPRRTRWDFPGARIEVLAGEDVEVLPGIRAIFTPGHTPGHQSVLVDDGGGKQLFVGDAVYTADIYNRKEEMTEQHRAWHAQGANPHWFESMEKLKRIDADVLHFAHDPDILRPDRSSPPPA